MSIILGTGTDGTSGTSVTSGAANAYGSWVSFGSVSFPVNKLRLIFDNTYATTFFVQVGIGASGSQVIVVPSLYLYTANVTSTFSIEVEVPLIPPGTDIWVALQSPTASATQRVAIVATFDPQVQSDGIVPLGLVPATTTLTSFSMGANAYGSWVSLGTLSVPGRSLLYYAERDPSSLNTINIGVGPTSPPEIITQNLPATLYMNVFEIDQECPPGQYWIQGIGTEVYASIGAIWVQT